MYDTNQNIDIIVYLSPDINESPDFSSKCFKARLIKLFDDFDTAYIYAKKRRNIVPALYNPNKQNEHKPDTDSMSPLKASEYAEKIDVIKKFETLRSKVSTLNGLAGIEDLTAEDDVPYDNVSGYLHFAETVSFMIY